MDSLALKKFEQVFSRHIANYPLMRPEDVYKLIYQSAFGVGHFIKGKSALAYLLQEMEACEKASLPRFEEIGNGFIRINIACFAPSDAIWIVEEMEDSCKEEGNSDDFYAMLDVAKKLLCENKSLGFELSELESLVSEMEKIGLPAVHHSEAYRKAYAPAYRVIKYNKRIEDRL